MKVNRKLRIAILLEVLALVSVLTGLVIFPEDFATSFYLFELLGVFAAGLITTSGLYGMKRLT